MEREFTPADHKHIARVYLAEARRSRQWPSWHAWLLRMAAKNRRLATPAQRELFA